MESRGCASVLKGTRTKDTGWPKNIGNVRTLPSADYSSIDMYPREIVLVLGLLLVLLLVVFVLVLLYFLYFASNLNRPDGCMVNRNG